MVSVFPSCGLKIVFPLREDFFPPTGTKPQIGKGGILVIQKLSQFFTFCSIFVQKIFACYARINYTYTKTLYRHPVLHSVKHFFRMILFRSKDTQLFLNELPPLQKVGALSKCDGVLTNFYCLLRSDKLDLHFKKTVAPHQRI